MSHKRLSNATLPVRYILKYKADGLGISLYVHELIEAARQDYEAEHPYMAVDWGRVYNRVISVLTQHLEDMAQVYDDDMGLFKTQTHE